MNAAAKSKKHNKQRITMRMRVPVLLAVLLPLLTLICAQKDNNTDARSSFSRGMAAQGARMTFPEARRITQPRATYPEDKPHVCLAFLSCCGRTDLLNHTMSAVIRHMEQDEPSVRYEIAWVDNGNPSNLTTPITDSHQIEHALLLPQNAGLAYGMNLLIFNLCTAPYILLLEEDWLYLDWIVATQTEKRKRAIATALALLEQKELKSFDERSVMGVFLRPETYHSFLRHPFAHDWARTEVDLSEYVAPSCEATDNVADSDVKHTQVNYQIFCADNNLKSTQYIWGSYTNGAGLYKRDALAEVGRMYGEPGDAFHDRYVEVNYAYRAALKYCHAAIQLGECREIGTPECTAAFYHIGGGRGTRPRTVDNSKCTDVSWTFYGTPMYDTVLQAQGMNQSVCSKEDLEELRDARAKQEDAAEYREQVREENRKVFEMEQQQREEMRTRAHLLQTYDKDLLRLYVDWLADKTDEEIDALGNKMEALANSPHPLKGFWDSHGRPLV